MTIVKRSELRFQSLALDERGIAIMVCGFAGEVKWVLRRREGVRAVPGCRSGMWFGACSRLFMSNRPDQFELECGVCACCIG
ncbi:hypothetical protein [Nocardia wallacei]|uniref:hypothetical protein n=1 Tax=Nocardia wallacei TaxID=480035 RepID=UPI0024542A99|nr:hypothetical protein [Nocardia wallacei]